MREQGGVLGVELASLEVDASKAVQFPNLKPGGYLGLTIKDTGCGMDGEVMERMFEPFFTTKKPGEGAGMGLAVVHGIVKSHGGYVFAESELERGARSRFFYPRSRVKWRTRAFHEGPSRGAASGSCWLKTKRSWGGANR